METEQRRLDPERIRPGVAAVLEDPARGIYFVAEVDANVAGQTLITYEWSDWRNGNFWWIQSVYVAEAHRGRGVFRALFEHVHAAAKARPDVCGVRLYMDAHNDRARQAYERLGLKRTNYEMFETDFVL
jgi:GNAT superfamily N-acetyltransferase